MTSAIFAGAPFSGAIELRSVSHTHSAGTPWSHPALHGIDLTIGQGERVLVSGVNGSGKSTLAWILAGLISPSEGTATWGGEPLTEMVDLVGLLVQHTRLQLLRPTVAAEIGSFGMSPERIQWALQAMGFPLDVLHRSIDELSVGQQRRLGLAVLLGRGCEVLILDEPMAGLDTSSRQQLITAIDELPRRTTVVTVTHDLDDSLDLGDRCISLEAGRIVADEAKASSP